MEFRVFAFLKNSNCGFSLGQEEDEQNKTNKQKKAGGLKTGRRHKSQWLCVSNEAKV